ncbi:hypothetical protein [Geotoga petraea]|jgi:hypothetical protein|uniref:Flagellar protein FliT n=1 Tax=Geotoga petraea TaxID=28234 RepID=A0A1G6JUX0_9BACT|nr:hypothetical protein [Geotoga petraea]MDK2945631.1 hypothetical protein [Geotoga sp.]SDC22458.1 hypothetical protein SAMN04488588_0640 [Geotoga petraea]
MSEFKQELNLLIEELSNIEKSLDDAIKSDDFIKYNSIMDSRMKTFKKLENFFDDEKVKNILKDIIKKDEERKKIVEEKISNLKKDQMNLQKGKNAIKKGYYNVQEGLRRKKIDKSG